MVALEQQHDRQVLGDRAEIISEPSHSCKVQFVRYQEAFHALHICVTSKPGLHENFFGTVPV